jgi:hypothetical protein
MFHFDKPTVENTSDDGISEFAPAELATCKWVGEKLERFYPGHPWMVMCRMSKTGGIVQIQLRGLMPVDYWYVLQLDDVLHDASGTGTVRRAAGELLERYQIARGKFSDTDWRSAINLNPIGNKNLEPLR